MNILFVNYGDLRSNSMNHIGPYADALAASGHSCAVAVDEEETPFAPEKALPLYSLLNHQQLESGTEAFPNAKPADILHAWTPRENVRKAVENYLSRHPATRVVVHLEDNEEAILESAYQKPIAQLRELSQGENSPKWNPRLSHPTKFKRFLSQADGVTLLAPSLEKLLPTPKLTCLIDPILPPLTTVSPEDSRALRSRIGIAEDESMIFFPGGISSSNREDVRNLYEAVALLNRAGTPCRIVKTGPNCEDFTKSFAFPLDAIAIDLGFVETDLIKQLLQAADALAQPGKENAFNRDRFPCKIPEFLASGRPCILPRMYARADDPESPYCLFLSESSPSEIADQLQTLFSDRELAAQLAANARQLAAKRFNPTANRDRLLEFYDSIKSASPKERKAGRYHFPLLKESNERLERELEDSRLHSTTLEAKIAAQAADFDSNQSSLDRLRQTLRERDEKIMRMQETASWKLTAPLRWLRRKLLDPLKKTPAAASASHQEASTPGPEPIEEPEANLPPEGHPSYHKNYYQYVAADAARIENFVSRYAPPPQETAPLISILLPVYNVDETWLRRCIESVLEQVYPYWELCIADDRSDEPHIQKVIEEYLSRDSRIKAIFRESNGHISRATNSAFTLASGEYLALLDHDDELTPHALARVAETIHSHPDAGLIYSDEDKIDEYGLRHGPHFKSDWNYELLLGCNMISHLGVYRRDLFEKVGGFRFGHEGAQDWDLALRVIEQIRSEQIVHIPEILYHWRDIEGSTAQNLGHKDYANSAQKRAIESHLERIGVAATLSSVDGFDWKVNYPIPEPQPSVSIIILTKDRKDLLKPCIDSIAQKLDYSNYEIAVVDHESSDPDTIAYLDSLSSQSRTRVIKAEGDFNFSRLNNQAIASCDSELICLLNNDVEAIDSRWLSEMVQHGIREEIGVVGAKLLFPHDHVQHGGVIMGIGGIAAHAFKYLHRDDDGHIHRAHLVSAYSAVTGACMLFRKSTWERLSGFDEANLPISYNDVDFCLRAGKLGLRSLVTPFALLYHKESETRGPEGAETSERFERESAFMRERWDTIIKNDPYYNPNLTRDNESFSYRDPPSRH